MVETKGASPYAPKNERLGGRVRYLAQGLESIVTERREDAYKQMHEKCSGSYEIVREWDSVNDKVTGVYGSTSSTVTAQGTSTPYAWNASGYGSSSGSAYAMTSDIVYRNIDFSCVPRPTAAAQARALESNTARGSVRDNSIEHAQPPLVPLGVNSGERPAMDSTAEDQILGFLTLELGCDRSQISLVASQRPAHRLVACGRSYVCIEGAPTPTCRLALSEQFDGGAAK
jgi:hypothetical protein